MIVVTPAKILDSIDIILVGVIVVAVYITFDREFKFLHVQVDEWIFFCFRNELLAFYANEELLQNHKIAYDWQQKIREKAISPNISLTFVWNWTYGSALALPKRIIYEYILNICFQWAPKNRKWIRWMSVLCNFRLSLLNGDTLYVCAVWISPIILHTILLFHINILFALEFSLTFLLFLSQFVVFEKQMANTLNYPDIVYNLNINHK